MISRTAPTAVAQGEMQNGVVASISAGTNHTCASSGGNGFCWGMGGGGRLGNGESVSRLTPVALDTSDLLSGKVISLVVAGDAHSCALAEGEVFCWGYHASAGNGTRRAYPSPVAISPFPEI